MTPLLLQILMPSFEFIGWTYCFGSKKSTNEQWKSELWKIHSLVSTFPQWCCLLQDIHLKKNHKITPNQSSSKSLHFGEWCAICEGEYNNAVVPRWCNAVQGHCYVSRLHGAVHLWNAWHTAFVSSMLECNVEIFSYSANCGWNCGSLHWKFWRYFHPSPL